MKAYLIEEDNTAKFYEFDYNPETIDFSFSSNLASHNAAGVVTKTKTWYNSDGVTWKLNNLLVSTFRKRQSVQAQIDKLMQLRNPKMAKDGTLALPVLYFVWGTNKRGPACVTDVQVTENAWDSNGNPTHAVVSLTLIEMPHKGLKEVRQTSHITVALTDREVEVIRVAAAKRLAGVANIYSVNPNTWVVSAFGIPVGMGDITTPHFYTVDDINKGRAPNRVRERWQNRNTGAGNKKKTDIVVGANKK